MKRWFPLIVAGLLCVPIARGETVQEIYAQGVRASIAGDTQTAKRLFQQVLAAEPGNTAAAANLRRIEMTMVSKGNLKSRAESTNVPKIDFKEASLTSVLDYLPKLAAGQSLNIVRMFPKEYGDEKKITLQLTNVPMSSVLEYIAQLGGLTLAYDKSAIVLSPLPSVSKQAQ
jgi:hypothetical protein